MVHSEKDGFQQESIEQETLGQETLEKLAQQVGISARDGKGLYDNWLLLASIAQPLMNFPLPQPLDPAPRFEP